MLGPLDAAKVKILNTWVYRHYMCSINVSPNFLKRDNHKYHV